MYYKKELNSQKVKIDPLLFICGDPWRLLASVVLFTASSKRTLCRDPWRLLASVVLFTASSKRTLCGDPWRFLASVVLVTASSKRTQGTKNDEICNKIVCSYTTYVVSKGSALTEFANRYQSLMMLLRSSVCNKLCKCSFYNLQTAKSLCRALWILRL